MADLEKDTLVFRFPEVHPEAKLTVSFIRTLRLPDDGKKYPLPPGLGNFPLKHVDDYQERIPEKWKGRGGVMIPMFQSEALWIRFDSVYLYDRMTQYPFAVKIAAGKRSAMTGKAWKQSLCEGDYLVSPQQPWIDGFVVSEGVVRQFVAVPLGAGLTVESQLSGKEDFGGIQIQVFPMKKEVFNRKFPVKPRVMESNSFLRGCGPTGPQGSMGSMGPVGPQGSVWYGSPMQLESLNLIGEQSFSEISDSSPVALNSCYNYAAAAGPAAAGPAAAAPTDMGMGAGGLMDQQVFTDPHGTEVWDQSQKNRCFVHITNSLAWQAITGAPSPTVPQTASVYARYSLPWFEFYREDLNSLPGTKALKGIKTVAQMGAQKGIPVLPENESVQPKAVVKISPKTGKVRDGKWV